jgi:hypothetical protein
MKAVNVRLWHKADTVAGYAMSAFGSKADIARAPRIGGERRFAPYVLTLLAFLVVVFRRRLRNGERDRMDAYHPRSEFGLALVRKHVAENATKQPCRTDRRHGGKVKLQSKPTALNFSLLSFL